MISNEMADYIVEQCERQYNLDHNDLLTNNKDNGKLKFGWKRSDLKLTVEFSQKKVASIIYHSFLDDFQTENMTEDDFTERFNDILAVRNIETSKDFHDIINKIIKSVNSGKIFGSRERDEIILDSEYRSKLRYIKVFFGEKAQEGKLFEELQELQEAVNKRRTSFWTKHEDDVIEEIADCLVVATQLKKTKLVINMIKGIVEKSSFLNVTTIEKIINIAKGKIDRTITRIENGEYGALMITDNSGSNSTNGNIELLNNSEEKVLESEELKEVNTNSEAKEVSEEELRSMLKSKLDIEDEENKKKKIILALSKNTPWVFRSKELAEWTDIKAKECTQLIIDLIVENKVIITKKGKDKLYNSVLDLNKPELEKRKVKTINTTNSVIIGGSTASLHAKGKD